MRAVPPGLFHDDQDFPALPCRGFHMPPLGGWDRASATGRRNPEINFSYGLNPTLCHSSAVWYMVPLVMTYSTVRLL